MSKPVISAADSARDVLNRDFSKGIAGVPAGSAFIGCTILLFALILRQTAIEIWNDGRNHE